MRRLVAGAAAALLLVVGLSGCDRFAPENSLGHCAQARDWRVGNFWPLEHLDILTWARVRRNGDWWYECSGVDTLGRNFPPGIRICWETHYASESSPPHEPLDLKVCGTPV